jgi:uncharacterized protein (DUF1800 family)/fibronectin type 3 domain-containing protein
MAALAMPLTVEAGGHAQSGSERRKPRPAAAAPTQAPARVAIAATSGQVELQWSAVDGARGYAVYRGVAGVWTPEPIAKIQRRHFTDRTAVNGVVHAYKVAAFNAGGVGPQSDPASATPLAPPTSLKAEAGDQKVALTWVASTGATGYVVMRGLVGRRRVPVAEVTGTSYLDTGLTNDTTYVYRVRAKAPNSLSRGSELVSATPKAAPDPKPTTAPTLSGTGGDGLIDLSWTAVTGATSYKVFNVTSGTPALVTTVTTRTFRHTPLPNGTAVSYQVAGTNSGGDGPSSNVATATPNPPIAAPTNLSATPGNGAVTLSWTPVSGATKYRVYRALASNGQTSALATEPTAPPFNDAGLTNGTTYFYKITAVAGTTESARSAEASATPAGSTVDPTILSAYRFLRHATWGPRPGVGSTPGDVDRVLASGFGAYVDEQMGAPMSTYPDTLYDLSVEHAQEHFMSLAVSGPDQLRQRVAFALHKMWVVSAVEVNNPRAIVPYYRIMMNNAFGNYRTLMRQVTLNPAMGRYLNMLNNRAQAVTGVVPNENYARELLQLFTMGLVQLNPNGTPVLDASGAPVPSYTEADVKALARIFTGWTFGNGNTAATDRPAGLAGENYTVQMEPVVATRGFHDTLAKTFLGENFPAGVDTEAELDHALDVIFNHPNVGPFVARQLIQQLVTSNPSPAYVQDIAAVFGAPGAPGRGELGPVVRAILTHPEANLLTPTSGKLSEPVLYALSMVRALNATVTDHPFLSDLTADMGQRVFYPPSVFSYFSPGFRVRGTGTPPLGGPEFQTLTSVTSLERANFAGRLLGNHFGTDVTVDYAPFTSRAANPTDLVEYANLLFMGGAMSAAEKSLIVTAVTRTPSTNPTERVRTAIYLTITAAQAQVDN